MGNWTSLPCLGRPPGVCAEGSSTAPEWKRGGTSLAELRAGARVLFATDEWFAVCENLLQHTAPTFDPNAFCSQGKVMDGWESRRRRLAGHDWCVIKLAYPGRILGVEVDTAWFTGNQAPQISLLAAEIAAGDDSWMPGATERAAAGGGQRGSCKTPAEIEAADASVARAATWHSLLPVTPLRPGYPGSSVHHFTAGADLALERATHLRLNYFPDGGVARLRVYGRVKPALATGPGAPSADLAALENGGRGLGESNAHYGRASNMLQPGRGIDMGDGWETARHPDRPAVLVVDPATGLSNATASDWAVVRLGAACARVEQLVVDTNHFKGNCPESVEVHACSVPAAQVSEVCCEPSASPVTWRVLLPRTRVDASREHLFFPTGASDDELAAAANRSDDPQAVCERGLSDIGPVTHLRLTIFPDGGVMRLRVIGRPSATLSD